jgi:hypothetical protein
MHRVGDTECGFTVTVDAATRTVRVEAWGFWRVGIAPMFGDALLDACRGGTKPRRVDMELTQLKPLREEGEDAWLKILTWLPNAGIEAIVVTTNSLTKLQLLRIAKKSASKTIVQFQ